ncbi:MAG: kinase, partial [Alistipes sp.]|nr:kinase [Alistipes sp.]
MEFYGKIIAVTVQDLTRADDGEAVMSIAAYRHLVRRSSINILRPGKGLGSYALIEYSSLPLRFRERFEAKYGDPEAIMKREEISLPQDMAAQEFFRTHKLANGESIPEDKQEEYIINARVLNALRDSLNTQKAMRRACNNNTPVIWANIFAQAEQLREVYNHTLPKSEARLRDKLRQYSKDGYSCLVSGKFGNGNTLKITKEAGRQIIALRRSHIPVYTTQQVFDEFNRIAEKKGWKPLRSKNALLAYLERPDVKPLWYDAVYGEYAAKQLFARQHKTDMPIVRDALWYGDGTKLNLYYKAYEGG